jgi:hypothetical protein
VLETKTVKCDEVVKPEGKRPFGRPRHKLEDGIRMDLRDIGRGI